MLLSTYSKVILVMIGGMAGLVKGHCTWALICYVCLAFFHSGQCSQILSQFFVLHFNVTFLLILCHSGNSWWAGPLHLGTDLLHLYVWLAICCLGQYFYTLPFLPYLCCSPSCLYTIHVLVMPVVVTVVLRFLVNHCV